MLFLSLRAVSPFSMPSVRPYSSVAPIWKTIVPSPPPPSVSAPSHRPSTRPSPALPSTLQLSFMSTMTPSKFRHHLSAASFLSHTAITRRRRLQSLALPSTPLYPSSLHITSPIYHHVWNELEIHLLDSPRLQHLRRNSIPKQQLRRRSCGNYQNLPSCPSSSIEATVVYRRPI